MDKDNLPKLGSDTRRNFIKKAATAAAGSRSRTACSRRPFTDKTQAPSTGRVIGANDRIVLGFVGLGNQGLNSHLKPMLHECPGE